jgi:hypothetical protein
MIKINAPVPTSSGPNIIDLAAKHKLPHSGLLLDAAKAKKAEIKAAIKPLRLGKDYPQTDPLLPSLKGKEREQNIFETDSDWTSSSESGSESEDPVESADSILERQVALGPRATPAPPPVAAQAPKTPPPKPVSPKAAPGPKASGPPEKALPPPAPALQATTIARQTPPSTSAKVVDKAKWIYVSNDRRQKGLRGWSAASADWRT